jgi:hypothetical protein
MTRCWIRNTGASESAGPFTLDDLRGLIRAGFLPMWALASTTDAYTGFRIIEEWPELVDALNTPGVRVMRGGEDLRLGERHVVPDTAGPESLVPEERGSSLKLGRVDYDDSNRMDKAPSVDALDLLKGNREAEIKAKYGSLPWYRYPFFRNMGRLMVCAVISAPLFYFGYVRLATDESVGIPLFTAGALILIGGGYYIFFVSKSRFDID